MKQTKIKKRPKKIITKGSKQNVEARQDLLRKKMSTDLQALILTWEQDLCE